MTQGLWYRVHNRQIFLNRLKQGIEGKIQKVRADLFYQIKSCYSMISRDKIVSTHVRELGFQLSMIPESLQELENLLGQYMENKELYDKRMAEKEAMLKDTPLTSPKRRSIVFSFNEEAPSLNRRVESPSEVLLEHAALRYDELSHTERFRVSPVVRTS